MTGEKTVRPTKQERREERRRAAHRRRTLGRLRRAGLATAILAVPALWAWERSGSQEMVDAEVVETRRWQHFAKDGTSHPHRAATLRIEGLSETTVERADSYARGQRVPVWIRRGRISGWPYFQDLAKPGETGGEPSEETGAEAEPEP